MPIQLMKLGNFHDGNSGLRVGLPGYDPDPAIGAVDNEQLAFNSDWPALLPIHERLSFTISIGGTVTTYFSAALPYIPWASYIVTPHAATLSPDRATVDGTTFLRPGPSSMFFHQFSQGAVKQIFTITTFQNRIEARYANVSTYYGWPANFVVNALIYRLAAS